MKIYKLKKNMMFSLIVFMVCCVVLYSANSIFNINDFINTKIEIIKEKEMKFMFGELSSLGDKYSENSLGSDVGDASNVNYQTDAINQTENTLMSDVNYRQVYIQVQNQNKNQNANSQWNNYFAAVSQYENISSELEKLINKDSFRNNGFELYYIFNYEYTMESLKELEPMIEKEAEAQKVPKALIKAVIFREMMFLGQEDMLDGLPLGGKSIGICQIGLDNVRFNEQTVYGKDSVISNKTDNEIIALLQNPKQAVYFCAVQLRARAIKLTNDKNINLNELNEEQIHKILEEYNQSKITMTAGPIKTKAKYAEETYKYYELFSKYYELEQTK